MPPKRGKKAVAPAKPALDGCKIALSGTFPGATHAAIKARVETLGATVASTVTDDATHLVATETDYNKPSPKVAKAQTLGIHIVGLDWLSSCEQSSIKEREEDHVPGASTKDNTSQVATSKAAPSQANGASTTTSRTRKRAPSPVVDNAASDTEVAPKAKKARGRKAAAVKAEEDDDAQMQDVDDVADEQPKEEKKGKEKGERAMGEGQVAKNKDLQIPLDEGCPFVTAKVYIDDSGVIHDVSLNQTNASNNNNKFYRLQVRPTRPFACGTVV
jgi:poly [ADP-ribose] polymerase